MSIQFEEQNYQSSSFATQGTGQSKSELVNFFIKQGLVKDEAGANMILVVGSLMFIALSIYFFIFGFSLPSSNATPAPQAIPGEADSSLEF